MVNTFDEFVKSEEYIFPHLFRWKSYDRYLRGSTYVVDTPSQIQKYNHEMLVWPHFLSTMLHSQQNVDLWKRKEISYGSKKDKVRERLLPSPSIYLGGTQALAGNSIKYEVCDSKSEKSAPMYCFEWTPLRYSVCTWIMGLTNLAQ